MRISHASRDWTWVVVLLGGLLVGCDQADRLAAPRTTPRSNVPAFPALGQTLGDGGMNTIDDQFARIDSVVPGFGGLFFDTTDRLTVWLADTTKGAQVADAIRAALPSARSHLDRGFAIRKGKYGYGQLLTWYRSLGQAGLGPEVITLTDIQEDKNRIFLGVINSTAIQATRLALESVGVPSDAFAVGVVPRPHPAIGTGPTLMDTVNAIVGGVYIASPNLGHCSLGFNVEYNGTMYYATASHCTPNQGVVDSTDVWYQPGFDYKAPPLTSSYLSIGKEVIDKPLRSAAAIGSRCSMWSYCRMADVALHRYENSSRSQSYAIARTTFFGSPPDTGSKTISTSTPTFPISAEYGAYNLYVGTSYVHKMGAKTGWTWGQVFDTCVNFSIFYNGAWAGQLCQYGARFRTEGGDSGAPVFLWNIDNTAWLVGLLSSGGLGGDGLYYSYFSPIEGITNDLSPYWTWHTY